MRLLELVQQFVIDPVLIASQHPLFLTAAVGSHLRLLRFAMHVCAAIGLAFVHSTLHCVPLSNLNVKQRVRAHRQKVTIASSFLLTPPRLSSCLPYLKSLLCAPFTLVPLSCCSHWACAPPSGCS